MITKEDEVTIKSYLKQKLESIRGTNEYFSLGKNRAVLIFQNPQGYFHLFFTLRSYGGAASVNGMAELIFSSLQEIYPHILNEVLEDAKNDVRI